MPTLTEKPRRGGGALVLSLIVAVVAAVLLFVIARIVHRGPEKTSAPPPPVSFDVPAGLRYRTARVQVEPLPSSLARCRELAA